MDLAFGGATALEVIRSVRRNESLRLEPVEDVDMQSFAFERGELGKVNFLAAGLAAAPSRSRPATIRVPDVRRRHQAEALHCLLFPKGLGQPHLLQLKGGEGSRAYSGQFRHVDLDLFDGRRVFVDCVPLAFLTVAASYQRLIRAGRLGVADAVVRLVELVMEFTGHYGRDPLDPLAGEISEGLPPVTTVSQIRSFVEGCDRVQGTTLLMRALSFARDGSRSAMETCLWIVLTMPASYGFFGLSSARLNVSVVASDAQRRLMRHRVLTPDIQWSEMRVAVEYQGLDPHAGKAAHTEDNRRMNDYQVCGYRAFFVTFDDVRSVSALDALVTEIAQAMREHGFPNEYRRIRRLLEDETKRRLRAHHLSHLLPPIRREDE